MSVKTPINTAIHVIFCTAIAFLLAFIVRENAVDYDADIQVLAQKVARNGQLAIAVSNDEYLRSSIKKADACAKSALAEYYGFINAVKLKTDSIQYLIDSLSQNDDVELLFATQKILNNQRSSIGEMSDLDKSAEVLLLGFQSADWLYQSKKNDTEEQYKTVLEQAKINSLLVERLALNYFARKVAVCDCYIDYFQPLLNWESINPTVGDTVFADIQLSGYAQDYNNYKFMVNGNSAPNQKFKQRFNQAGTYPLHIKVEYDDREHDTVLVAEKTYYLTVHK